MYIAILTQRRTVHQGLMTAPAQNCVPEILNAFSLVLSLNLPEHHTISKSELLAAIRKAQKETTLPTFEGFLLDPRSSVYDEAFVPCAKDEIEREPRRIAAINACVKTMNDQKAPYHDILKAFEELHFITKGARVSVLFYCGKELLATKTSKRRSARIKRTPAPPPRVDNQYFVPTNKFG